MLSLLKKKKNLDSESSCSKDQYYENNRFSLYKPVINSQHQEFGCYFNQVPSAPVKFTTKAYLVDSYLEVTTQKRIENGQDALKILDRLVDIYDGSLLSKGLIIPVYVILGMRLKLSDQYLKNRFVYKNGITEIMSFTGEDKIHLRDNKLEYSKSFSTKLYGDECYVIFRITLQMTKRKGPNVFDVYRYPINGQIIERDIKEMLESHDLGVEIDGDGTRGIVNLEAND
ncbi:matrix protein [Obodhiang virus]|uniref:Matrix protein n=1 Tax=Obodhiang virus TaxID=380160 RepID=H8XWS7_9RHAB|nr:matrix protein [Obodhiang virus]AEI17643.1 matrix protein [Obodhiang virus]